MPLFSYFTMKYVHMSHFIAPPTLWVNAASICNQDHSFISCGNHRHSEEPAIAKRLLATHVEILMIEMTGSLGLPLVANDQAYSPAWLLQFLVVEPPDD